MKKKKRVLAKKRSKLLTPKNTNLILGVVIVVLILAIFLLTNQNQKNPVTEKEGSDDAGAVQRELDNEILFGWNNRDDYKAHGFVCRTCCCDESRKDYIYVSNGNVEFDLMTVPNQTNILTITVDHLSDKCRKNEVYVDGSYIGNLNKDWNVTRQADFTFNITPKRDRIHVKVEHVSKVESCWWGNDLKRARIDVA